MARRWNSREKSERAELHTKPTSMSRLTVRNASRNVVMYGKVSALGGPRSCLLFSSNLRLGIVVMPPDLEDAGRPEWKSRLKRDDHSTF